MIQVKELRYGNKVQTCDAEIITIQQILSRSVVYDSSIAVTNNRVHVNGSYQDRYVIELAEEICELDFQSLYPIALTPQILKKFGFRNFLREEWIVSIGNSHIDFEFVNGILKLRCPAPALTNIKYVHQLQNLLFAISGIDIDIDL
jgi:hypothetical protein